MLPVNPVPHLTPTPPAPGAAGSRPADPRIFRQQLEHLIDRLRTQPRGTRLRPNRPPTSGAPLRPGGLPLPRRPLGPRSGGSGAPEQERASDGREPVGAEAPATDRAVVAIERALRAIDDAAEATADPVPAPADGAGQRRSPAARRDALVARIHEASRRLGVDPGISEGVARAESNLDASARSSDGLSVGAFQLTAPTAAEMRRRLAGGRAAGLPLGDEVTLGVGYLRYLDGLFARRAILDPAGRTTTPVGDPAERRRFAVAAYNAGEGRVAGAQRRAAAAGGDPGRFADVVGHLPPITQRYVERVLAFAAAAGSPRTTMSV
jgi:soluble lytic murein transglycosylase-like protein